MNKSEKIQEFEGYLAWEKNYKKELSPFCLPLRMMIFVNPENRKFFEDNAKPGSRDQYVKNLRRFTKFKKK